MTESIFDVARRADQFFMEASPIHETMLRLSRILDAMQIPFAIAGDYPGDGLPKPFAFPSPETVSVRNAEGVPILRLESLLELKLASGMTAAHRPRDFDDVIQLIRVNQLPLEFAGRLNPYVADKFRELWQAAQVDDDY